MARAWRKKNRNKRRQKALDNLLKNNCIDALYGDERRRKEVEILKSRLAQAGVDHGTERESTSGYSLYQIGKGWV